MADSLFPPSRAEALRRLAHFIPKAGSAYAAGRNTDSGPDQQGAVSKLSPYLRYRLLTEQETVAEVLGRHSLTAAEKFVQEVLWRTYWKGWLEMRPEIWSRYLAGRDADRERFHDTHALADAEAGRTGIEGFDDWARELVTTGYLHNHARMWFASIWVFTLRLPWTLGADFFLRHLIDADPASNTLSWRWVAGLQTPGKTYLARADNIAHYTDGVHAPESGQLASAPLNLKEEPLPKVAAWTEDAAAVALLPMYERVGLWLHPEDLAVEQGELARLKLTTINASWPTLLAVRAGWSDKVSTWTQAALRDGATRAGSHFGAEVAAEETSDLAMTLVAWAQRNHLQAIVAYRPFIGPWLAEALALETALATAGIRVIWRRRAWDTEHFPHATRGYFPFWEKIKSAQ